jgi:hypothetical protein
MALVRKEKLSEDDLLELKRLADQGDETNPKKRGTREKKA